MSRYTHTRLISSLCRLKAPVYNGTMNGERLVDRTSCRQTDTERQTERERERKKETEVKRGKENGGGRRLRIG